MPKPHESFAPYGDASVESQLARLRCLLYASAVLLDHDSEHQDDDLHSAVEILVDESRRIAAAIEDVHEVCIVRAKVKAPWIEREEPETAGAR